MIATATRLTGSSLAHPGELCPLGAAPASQIGDR
jgi:hypothetical protein